MSKKKTALFLHLPVLHQGFLDLLESRKFDEIYIFDQELLKKLDYKQDIASFEAKKAMALLKNLGFLVNLLSPTDLKNHQDKKIFLIDDQLGRRLKEDFLEDFETEFLSVFLRWDRDKVFSQKKFDCKNTSSKKHQELMKKAYKLSQRSGDWWRQVGALITKDDQVLEGWNTALPNEHTAYQFGAIRDQMEVGEKPELTHYIHAEQKLIAQAAKDGIALKDTDIYVTHFPCPVCAKLIAETAFRTCYFAEGSSVLEGEEILKAGGVELVQVVLD